MDRFLNKHHSKFTWVMDWIYFLVLINLYAILFTIVGVGVLGFFPAWMTAHQLIKRRLNQEEFPLFKAFFETYKSYLWKSNALGYVFVVLGAIIALSWFYYLDDLSSTFHWIGLIGVGFLAILVILMIGITPISFVYFPKFKLIEHLKFTLMMTMGMPVLALVIFLNSLFFYGVVMIRFITIFPFLAFTLPALLNLLFARKRLLKLFTIFKDDHIMIRTLNSYANQDLIYSLWNQDQVVQDLDFEVFQSFMNDDHRINRRASLILTNSKEEALGMLLSRVDEKRVCIEMLYIDSSHRRRGYAKRMLTWLEKEAALSEIEEIILGDSKSLFEAIPQHLNLSLAFFRKMGYQMTSTTKGYQLKKVLRGKAT
jgi:uncharacterized membrane protein YesL/GNAT superfamily N-acetyltransferase